MGLAWQPVSPAELKPVPVATAAALTETEKHSTQFKSIQSNVKRTQNDGGMKSKQMIASAQSFCDWLCECVVVTGTGE